MALSYTKAEYIVLATASSELIWIKNLLFDFEITDITPSKIYKDNHAYIYSLAGNIND